jgi:undecaprenyl pyrophosphate synthase
LAKTELTFELEKKIHKATARNGLFGCFEVTIGFKTQNPERVDYITYDTKGIWRCYEIKVSKSDFHSKAKKTFIGHYNYFVMPKELYDEVKDEIPSHIGVYIGDWCIKNPKKQELQVDENILKDSLIRSLYRDSEKLIKLDNPNYISQLKSKIKKLTEKNENANKKYQDLVFKVRNKYGRHWDDDIDICVVNTKE